MKNGGDNQFIFDPQLPALSLIFDLRAVARLFQEQLPGVTDHQLPVTVKSCRLQETQYQPSLTCVATYDLMVERPDGMPWRTIGVIEITPTRQHHRLFDTDPQLPWLAPAVNRDEMGQRFATLLADGAGVATIEVCAITPIRYKPGSRCAFYYHLRSSSGQQVFFGKLLAQRGDWLMAILSELYQASLITPAMPRIAQPLAYWPEVHMLVQSAVTGRAELNIRAFDSAEDVIVREQWLRDAGIHLAALHASVEVEGPHCVIEDDLGELYDYRASVARVAPPLATKFEATIEEISVLAGGRVEPAPVASHGAFRTDQFMIENGRLVLIDLDSFCWANRARDIGNFLAYLDWKAIRQPQHATFIERAGRAFLDGYAMAGPAPDMHWLTLYRVASILKIIGRRFRSLSHREWPLVPQLFNAVTTLLQVPST
jgi:hypothetical protein